MTDGTGSRSGERPEDEIEQLRALVAAMPDPIYRITADGTFIGVEVPDGHPAAMPQERIPGLSIRGVMPDRQADVVMGAIAEALATGQMVAVEYHFTNDGERRWWEARIVPSGGEVLAIVREITDRRRSEADALRRARTDPLTGLANRAAFDEALDLAMSRAHRHGRTLALLFADLDGFKQVNDTGGHATGDAVLAEVARRISGLLRDGDLAARVGGDEIAILLEDFGSAHTVEDIALRVVDAVCAPYEIDGSDHRIGMSVGVAVYPDDAESAADLIGVADEAMYRAKERGGSRVSWGRYAG